MEINSPTFIAPLAGITWGRGVWLPSAASLGCQEPAEHRNSLSPSHLRAAEVTEPAPSTSMKNSRREKTACKIVKESEKLSPHKSAVEWKYEKSWVNKGGYVLNCAVRLWILSLSEPRNLSSRYGYSSMDKKVCAWWDTNKITLQKRKLFMS